MPLTASHGVFTSSRAIRSVSASDLNRLYFRSDNQVQFDGRRLTEADQTESLHHTLEIGHKDTKYLKKRLRVAPAMDRTCSRYYTDYFAKTHAEREFNSGLADSFRKINGEGTCVMAPSLSTGTLYSETFSSHGSGKMKDAKLPPQGYSQFRTSTVTCADDNYGTLSETQRVHDGQRQIPRGKERRPDLIHKPQTVVGDSYRTTYSRHHTTAAADVSASGYLSAKPEVRELPLHAVPSASTKEIFNASRSVLLGAGR